GGGSKELLTLRVSFHLAARDEHMLMPTLPLTIASSTSRPVQLRMRPDLQVTRQSYQGREYSVIKDPLALKYYRFEDEEYALLSLLDGQSSLDQVREKFESQFA